MVVNFVQMNLLNFINNMKLNFTIPFLAPFHPAVTYGAAVNADMSKLVNNLLKLHILYKRCYWNLLLIEETLPKYIIFNRENK